MPFPVRRDTALICGCAFVMLTVTFIAAMTACTPPVPAAERPDNTWEMLTHGGWANTNTHRMKVPGGWVYREIAFGAMTDRVAVAMVFVPDVAPERS